MNSHKLWNSSNLMILCFGCFMLAGLMFLAWLGSPPKIQTVGKELPTLDLQPLIETSETPTVESLQGDVAVLHFWGTWSPPCVATYPEFLTLVQHFAEKPQVKFLSVSCSSGPEYNLDELRQKTKAFMDEQQSVLATYSDPAAMTRGKLALLMPNGSFSYPTTLLVNQQGVIVEVLAGAAASDMTQLTKKIEELLNSQSR